jgi:ketosteroid isomerase-like protein
MGMQIDETTVQRVADELEIRKLVARYANAVTAIDANAWVDTWAEDGSWTIGGGTSTGHEALRATWTHLISFFDIVVQLPQHALLDISGDQGTGRWSMVEMGRAKDDGPPSITLGTYTDVYRREAAGWKFAERQFDFTYSGASDLSGHWFI